MGHTSIFHIIASDRTFSTRTLFLFSSLLQLRAAKRRSPVLLPARARFLFASGGPRGLGCGGDLCFLDRRCRVGPRLARLGFPGGDGEAAAAAQPWNKSLRPHPRFVGVHSGAGERSVGRNSRVPEFPPAWCLLWICVAPV